MTDDASTFVWSKEDAEYNYKLCLERIAVSPELLKQVIENFSKISLIKKTRII
jgi:hypothetical protein